MKVLRDAYAAQLPEKFKQIKQLWSSLPQDSHDEEMFKILYRRVHSLTGSGKTFGFSALSDVARELEHELKTLAEGKAVLTPQQRQAIQDLLSRLHQASLVSEGQADDGMSFHLRTEVNAVRRISIVEDDVQFAEMLKNQLSYFGYEVSVYNTLESFACAATISADSVVVMDISFPDDSLGGVHAMQKIQAGREVPVPVVFISSYDEMEARLGAVRAGGIAYFSKKLNISALIDRLDELTQSQPAAAYRVMIVDDSTSLTSFYSTVLEQAGMLTRVVNDPMKVMIPLIEFEPDLILIDMYMPGCNGMELARVIRQMDAFVGIPIVFLSAEQDIDKQLAALDLGGDDFLTKPILAHHLVASVNSRVRRSMLLRSFMLRDSLTGLLNHTSIKDQLDREVARARRNGTHCCFAMVDIDFFKRVNDTYGHPAGDRVIKSLSRLLRQRLRESDSVGRYGGEEFAVVLADTDEADAVRLLNTIREDFARLCHAAEGVEFSVTFSCGVADAADFHDVTKLCDAADKALYKAKHGGRNQVVTVGAADGCEG